MKPVWFTFLNGSDIEQLDLTDAEILDAVEEGLRAQGQGRTAQAEQRGPGQKLRFSRRTPA